MKTESCLSLSANEIPFDKVLPANIPTDLTYLIILRVHFRVQRFKKFV